MKKHIVILAISLLLLGAVSTFAKEAKSNISTQLTKEAVDNYLAGINSNNLGLRVSCAYYLGEYKTPEAIIPLMKMLNSEKSEEARIVAALSLIKIGTDKAVYAVKQAANLDKSERVRNLCEKFYNSFTYAEKEQIDTF